MTTPFRTACLLIALFAPLALSAPAQTISTAAGGGPDVTRPLNPSTANLSPAAMAMDANGNVYFSNGTLETRIFKFNLASQQLSWIAGDGFTGGGGDGGPAQKASFSANALAVDSAGDLFLADSNTFSVREISAATGNISTIAGNGKPGFSGDGGPATQAEFNLIKGLVLDSKGDLFILDQPSYCVREINASTQIITTVAGVCGQHSASGITGLGGAATAANFRLPEAIALDSAGDLYVADTVAQEVAEVNAKTGVITAVAGTTGAEPISLALDASNNLYLESAGGTVLKIPAGGGAAITVAGNTSACLQGPGAASGAAANVCFNGSGLGFALNGDLIANTGYGLDEINLVASTYTTVAGNTKYANEDAGPASQADFVDLYDVIVDPAGDLIMDDGNDGEIWYEPAGSGTLYAFAGTFGAFSTGTGTFQTCQGATDALGDGCQPSQALFSLPSQIFLDGNGNLLIADTDDCMIREVSATTGMMVAIAGKPGSCTTSGDGGLATQAGLEYPTGVYEDSAGDILIAAGNVVREVNASTGIITTIAGNGTPGYSGDGAAATSAELSLQLGYLFVDAHNHLFVADEGNHVVREINLGTGIITTAAGNGTPGYSGDGAAATAAELGQPFGLYGDSAGNLYISDISNHDVREVASNGTISTLAGNGTGGGYSGDGGPAASAELEYPAGISGDGLGNLYVAGVVLREIKTQPAVSLSANSLDFPSEPEGTTAPSETITVTNSGGIPLSISGLVLSGANAADFTASGCAASVAPNATCTLTVDFTPAAAGSRSATLTLTDNAPGAAATIALAGDAAEVTLSTPQISFGGQTMGIASSAKTVTLSNPGTGPLAITSIAVSGAYTETNNCGSSLAVGATCTISIVFKPTAQGESDGTLTISDSAAGSPQTVPITGFGLNQPFLTVSPASLTFPSENVGVSSPAQTFTVTNIGSASAQAAVVAVGAGFTATADPSCSALAPQASCTVSVIFTPTFAGVNNTSAQIGGGAPGEQLYEFLTGTGTAVAGAPAVIDTVVGNGPSSTSAMDPLNVSINPVAIATDSQGDTFFVNNLQTARILELTAAGKLMLVAGNGENDGSGDGGPALQAALGDPYGNAIGLAVDSAGNIYITDSAHRRVRKITAATGIITTIAGNGTLGVSGDGGPATQAELVSPEALAVDAAGDLFISDASASCVREVSAATGDIRTVYGACVTGSGNGYTPMKIAADAAGDLYVAQNTNQGASINKVSASNGAVTVYSALASSAGVEGIALDAAGDLFLAEDDQVQEIPVSTGAPINVAGVGFCNYGWGNVSGPALQACIYVVDSIAVTSSGAVVFNDVVDLNSLNLSTGVIATIAGNSGDSTQSDIDPADMVFSNPLATFMDAKGDLYIEDETADAGVIWELAAGSNTLHHVSGVFDNPLATCSSATDKFGDGCPALQVGTFHPGGIFVDGSGNILIADPSNGLVREVSASTGLISTIAGSAPSGKTSNGDGGPATSAALLNPASVYEDASGNIYIAESGDIRKVNASNGIISTFAGTGIPGYSGDGGPAASAQVTAPAGLFVDASGNVFFTDFGIYFTGSNRTIFSVVRKVSTSGVISTIAGSPTATGYSGDGGPATSAKLENPDGVFVDPSGNLFILDAGNNVVREVAASNGVITTLAGTGESGYSGDHGPAQLARMSSLRGLTGDAEGDLFVAGDLGGSVREILTHPLLAASVTALTFGTQAVGVAAPAQSVTFTNSGGAPLTISQLALGGANAAAFTETDDCTAAPIAVNASCIAQVTFNPAASGAASATLSLTTNAPGAALSVALSGTGAIPAATLAPSSLTFSSQTVGSASAAQTVTLTNSGSVPLTITSVAATGDFAETNTCGSSVAPAASCGISITFKPTAAGSRTGTLSVLDNAAGSPQTVALSGTGAGVATAALTPASLTFAAELVKNASAAQTLTLTNSGTAALAIASIAASGDFAQTNTCASSLAAAGKCTISVTFTPSATGSRAGTLTVTDSAAGSPQTAALAGTGQDLTIAPAGTSSSSATVTAGSAAQYSLSFSPAGGFSGTVALACAVQPASTTIGCTMNPSSLTLTGTAAQTVAVNVTTTARGAVPPPPSERPAAPWAFALLALGLAALLLRQSLRRRLLVGFTFALLALAVACGGGSSGVGGNGGNNAPPPGTPAGTYTVTVTGTAANGTRSIQLTMTVQ